MEKCCPNCINDKKVEAVHFVDCSRGVCSYCEAEKVALISPEELRDAFEVIQGCYKLDDDGDLLLDCLRRDLDLFNGSILKSSEAEKLLTLIFDDHNISSDKYVPKLNDSDQVLQNWNDFKNELTHNNRYFPETTLIPDRLENLLGYLLLSSEEVRFPMYRARLQTHGDTISVYSMGAPPYQLASHGRANPAGIPYLYLASSKVTAISEIRPHPGQVVTVADFEISQAVNIIDLRNPKYSVSPFEISDEDQLSLLIRDIKFLEKLGEELAKPVVPEAVSYGYSHTQYLCEYVKKAGYDGVMYKSSAGNGNNLALFKPSLGHATTTESHIISGVKIQVDSLNNEK